MYSVINVDISEQTTDFLTTNVLYQRGDTFYSFPIKYSHLAIIRGSSTVNGDSAHSNENLAKQKNYVSFYIRSIKINFEANFTVLRPITLQRTLPGYVVLFKLPYKDEDDIRGKLVSNRSGGMILYSHPENVLAYDIINFYTEQSTTFHFLNCNKPFIVGPNDYVGILYYFPNIIRDTLVSSTAKVVFKPL